jgi:DNA-binding response OmpR family regulator
VDSIIERTAGVEAALFLIEERHPDVVLIDANHLPAETIYLLMKARVLHPSITQVVMDGTAFHRQQFREVGADYVLDDRDLDREFTQILLNVQNQRFESPLE